MSAGEAGGLLMDAWTRVLRLISLVPVLAVSTALGVMTAGLLLVWVRCWRSPGQ